MANVYAPTVETENHTFLKKINEKISLFTDSDIDFIIMEGDWNFTETLSPDRLGGNPRLWTRSVTEINDIKDSYDLIDIWRHRNPTKEEYSYYRKTERRASRIDRFYLSGSLQSSIKNTEISPSTLSDHSTLLLHVYNKTKRGPGLWRLNTSLLEDISFKTELKTVIEQSKLEPSSDKRKQFDYIKFKVKEFCRKKSIELAKINKENMKSLEQKIKCAQERLQIDPTNIEIHQQLSDAQNSLDGHYQRIHKGLVLKSRTQYYEEGEKCTQFFLNSIKNNTNKTTIRQIKLNESSQIIDDPSLMMDEL